jgi:hypothetical protein
MTRHPSRDRLEPVDVGTACKVPTSCSQMAGSGGRCERKRSGLMSLTSAALTKARAAPVMSSLKTPSSTEMPLASAPAAKPASSKIWLA